MLFCPFVCIFAANSKLKPPNKEQKMRRLISLTSLITAIAITVASCQKEDDNGDLGGFWKLLQIEYTDSITIDTKEENLFWGIQLKLIEIDEHLGRFQHTGDSLYIQMIDTKSNALIEYGILDATNERFAIERLNRNSMQLKSTTARLRFRKF